MKIYIAGAFEDKKRLRTMGDRLKELGHEITASWLYSNDDEEITFCKEVRPYSAEEYAQADKIGRRDTMDVENSDILILDTFGRSGGGRDWEASIAYTSKKGVIRIGPPRTVFHCLLMIDSFHSWEDLLSFLRAC